MITEMNYTKKNWAKEQSLPKFKWAVYKNIERHTADTIFSWPNPKQWVIVHTSDLMMIIRRSIYILSIITTEMGKLKTYSPTYCIMDNGENKLNLTHTLGKNIWQAFCLGNNAETKLHWWVPKAIHILGFHIYLIDVHIIYSSPVFNSGYPTQSYFPKYRRWCLSCLDGLHMRNPQVRLTYRWWWRRCMMMMTTMMMTMVMMMLMMMMITMVMIMMVIIIICDHHHHHHHHHGDDDIFRRRRKKAGPRTWECTTRNICLGGQDKKNRSKEITIMYVQISFPSLNSKCYQYFIAEWYLRLCMEVNSGWMEMWGKTKKKSLGIMVVLIMNIIHDEFISISFAFCDHGWMDFLRVINCQPIPHLLPPVFSFFIDLL